MTVDTYKKKYNIPWTYGLICDESSNLYGRAVKKRMAGGWSPPMKTGEAIKAMIATPKRETKFRAEISKQNLGDSALPKHPLSVRPDGALETFTAKRERLAAKRGTKEFKQKMKNRSGQRERGIALGKAWKGKKQSPEHLRNRMKAIHGDDWEPKLKKEVDK
jgi:hypothetical protein